MSRQASHGRFSVQNQVFELSVGDVIQVGNQLVSIIEIDGDDIQFQVENIDDSQPESTLAPDVLKARPR